MYLLRFLEDGNSIELRFLGRRDAIAFIDFVRTYMEKSGAGNGYNAYWLLGPQSVPLQTASRDIGSGRLNQEFIKNMAQRLCDELAERRPFYETGSRLLEYIPLHGVIGGAIVFRFNPKYLPVHSEPAV